MTPFTRDSSGAYSGKDKKYRPVTVDPEFTPDLEAILNEAFDMLQREETVLFLFEDMFEIEEHFQAVLDWYKARGNRMDHRWQQGVKMTLGWVYFCPADVHTVPTRGVSKEFDLQPFADQLVRKTGLEARLRAKAEAS